MCQIRSKTKSKKTNTNNTRKVDIRAHETTNALVITAPPAEMQNLREIISQLDIRRAQVLIEAIIAEVKEDKAREFGVQLGSASKSSGALITSFAEGTNNNILSAIAGGSTGSGLSLAFANKSGDFGGLARVLNSDASTNILSTPSIVTLDNQEAKIVVGQNAPFVTGSYTSTGSNSSATNPFQTIERRDMLPVQTALFRLGRVSRLPGEHHVWPRGRPRENQTGVRRTIWPFPCVPATGANRRPPGGPANDPGWCGANS